MFLTPTTGVMQVGGTVLDEEQQIAAYMRALGLIDRSRRADS